MGRKYLQKPKNCPGAHTIIRGIFSPHCTLFAHNQNKTPRKFYGDGKSIVKDSFKQSHCNIILLRLGDDDQLFVQ
jgi:hypothetical protein